MKEKDDDLFSYDAHSNSHSAFGGFLDGMEKERKKAERLHKDKVKIAKQMKIAKANGMTVKHPNKLAKHHATNCGNAHCGLCGNPRRIRNEKTIQEKRIEQDIDFE